VRAIERAKSIARVAASIRCVKAMKAEFKTLSPSPVAHVRHVDGPPQGKVKSMEGLCQRIRGRTRIISTLAKIAGCRH